MFDINILGSNYDDKKLSNVKNNKFFIEECEILENMIDGIKYYEEIINNVELDKSNTKNSYIMWIFNKVDTIDHNKPINFTSARISMPDIDVDVPIKHRAEIIEYIKTKYGEDRVSQMVTYQTMKGAKALKEVFRAYGDMTFEEINAMTKNIIEESKIADQLQEMDEPSIIRWCLEHRAKDFKEWCEIDKEGNLTGPYADRFGQAIKLEGTKSAQAKHAAGIIIAPRPLAELCPMIYDSKTKHQIAGMEMNDLESLGLIKLDILGVAMLDKVMCMKELLSRDGIEFNPDVEEIGLDCEKTWELFGEGNTKGVFQLESRLGQTLSKELKPEHMEHLSALAAIIRPGCLESKKEDGKSITTHYIEKKNTKKEPEYLDESLRPILMKTYGEMCIEENSFISMANGTEKKIKDIISGEKTISVNEKTHKTFIDDCIYIDKTRYEYGYSLYLKNGYSVTLTYDHKVLTDTGWKSVEKLTQNDLIAVPNNQIKHTDDYRDLGSYDFFNNDVIQFYLAGQLLGDGCSGSCIASGTLENSKTLLKWIKQNTTLNTKLYKHQRCWYIGISHNKLLNHPDYGNRKTIYRYWVEKLGLHKTQNDKNIPKIVFICNEKIRRSFLAGLLDSDGYVGQRKSGQYTIHYCSNNYETINGIRKLLCLDGITSYITKDKKHIHIRNIDRFNKLIGPYIVIKKINSNISLTCKNNIGFVKTQTIKKHIKNKYGSVRKYENSNFSIRQVYSKTGLCGQWIGESVGIDYGDISWLPIKSIEKTNDKKYFYRISILNNHNVIANGIIVKNCYQEQAMAIAKDIAGFDLKQADILRKAIGKKKPEIMAAVKKEFIEGCKEANVVDEMVAHKLFEWIEKSQRYSFNKCLSPETIVETPDGFKTLDEVEIGDLVLCPNDDGDKFITVLNKFENGIKDLYEIELEDGKSISCTLDHKFLCSDGRKHPVYDIIYNNLSILVYNEKEIECAILKLLA